MKKVLLSLSMLAATVFAANAQNFKIWNSADGTGFASAGTPYVFDDNATFTVDTASAAPYTIVAKGTAGSNCGESGTDACYYISGFGNGSYAAPVAPSTTSLPTSIGYTAANFATDKFFMNVKTGGAAQEMKVKVQFTTFTNGVKDADIYGYEFVLDAASGATTAFKDISIGMNKFSKLVANNPDGATFLTSALAQKIGAIEFAVVLTSSGGIGAGEVDFKNITIGTSSVILGTQSAAANIASTKVFPNPATEAFTAEVTVKSAASATIILTDMMGKQIATKSVDANGQANFATSGLAAGMYTVTYVLDGTPAKTELVVVK